MKKIKNKISNFEVLKILRQMVCSEAKKVYRHETLFLRAFVFLFRTNPHTGTDPHTRTHTHTRTYTHTLSLPLKHSQKTVYLVL